jgi:hypothetical protein
MKHESIPNPTPEERANIETSRTVSDAELIKGGAKHVAQEESGEPRLEVTEYQFNQIHDRMKSELYEAILAKNEPLRQAVIKENWDWDVSTAFNNIPELKEKVDVIACGDVHDTYMLRLKEFPNIGIIVRSAHGGGDQTRIHFNYTDERSPDRTVYKEIETPPGVAIKKSDGIQIRDELVDNVEHSGNPFPNPEYEERKEEIVSTFERICAEHGITKLAMRGGKHYWGGNQTVFDKEKKKWVETEKKWGFRDLNGIELLDARYKECFSDTMGMPNYDFEYGQNLEYGGYTSKHGGYDTKKSYPTFDWYRES